MGRTWLQQSLDREDITAVGGVVLIEINGRDIEKLLWSAELDALLFFGTSKSYWWLRWSSISPLLSRLWLLLEAAKAMQHSSGWTTGFSQEQKHLKKQVKQSPVMLAANTSRLVNVMYKLIEDATKLAGDGCWDISGHARQH